LCFAAERTAKLARLFSVRLRSQPTREHKWCKFYLQLDERFIEVFQSFRTTAKGVTESVSWLYRQYKTKLPAFTKAIPMTPFKTTGTYIALFVYRGNTAGVIKRGPDSLFRSEALNVQNNSMQLDCPCSSSFSLASSSHKHRSF
jgi:hypothetical protein